MSSSSPSSPLFSTFSLARRCDDLHLHLRDGEAVLKDTVGALLRPAPPAAAAGSAQTVGGGVVRRATIMPNTVPPITDAKMATEYRQRILHAVAQLHQEQQQAASASPSPSPSPDFIPLMTLYLTDHTTPEQIREAKATGFIIGCKLYPKGATTHSSHGVTDVLALQPTLEAMAAEGLLLLIHGEVTDPKVDIFDRERSFLPTLREVINRVPTLRVVLEHVTTKESVECVKELRAKGARIGATVTPQHLLCNRNALFDGGMNPALYCLPILKTESDRQSILGAILDEDECIAAAFFAGTDSAPHASTNKSKSLGCAAGCFTSFASTQMYIEAIESAGRERGMDATHVRRRLEAFLSINGAQFYGMELNPTLDKPIEFERKEWTVPMTMPFGCDEVIPFRAGQRIQWSTRCS